MVSILTMITYFGILIVVFLIIKLSMTFYKKLAEEKGAGND